ncbi:hypothetical protein ACWD11_30280 [Streptomyces sp. NPDC002776]
MTALRATPADLPPRLPSRDRSTAGERAPRGLSPMLSRLAAERATGVLLRECGTLYLAEGRVVHAESPAAPGLDVLLTAHGTLDTAVWQDAVARADDLHGAARLLVDSGRLTPGTLELCHLGALYDAAYFALAPSSTPGRFRYGAGHWLGPVRPVPVAAVERETLRRRDLLHRIWPDPGTDSAPLTRADPPRTPLTARQRAVVALLDGARTATDIARALGRPAFHTLVDIRRLAAAGVLTPHPAPSDRSPTPTHPEPPNRGPAADRPRPEPPDRAPAPQRVHPEPPDRRPAPAHPEPSDRRPAPQRVHPEPSDWGPAPAHPEPSDRRPAPTRTRPQPPDDGPAARPEPLGWGPAPQRTLPQPPGREPTPDQARPAPSDWGPTADRPRPDPPDWGSTPQRAYPEPSDRRPAPARTRPDRPDPGPAPQRARPEPSDRRPAPARTRPDRPDPGPAPQQAGSHPADPPSLPVRPRPPAPAERLAPDDPDVALLKRVRDALEAL